MASSGDWEFVDMVVDAKERGSLLEAIISCAVITWLRCL